MTSPRLTLRAKLVLAAGAFTLLTQLLLLLFMSRSIDAQFELDTRQRITATTSMLNAALAPVVFRRDYSGARDLLEDILRRGAGNLDYVDIIDNRGLPFAQAGVERPDIPEAGLPLDIREAVFHGTTPLLIGDQPVGTVRFGLSRRVQLQARNDLLAYGVSLSALAGLVMVAAFMLIGYFLTRDLQRLLQATRAVAAGDYDIDVRIAARDEVGDLARHFNRMVEVLRTTIAQLKDRSDRFHSLSRLSSDWFWEQDEHFRFKDPQYIGSNQDFHARSPVGKTRWELESSNLTPGQWAEHRAVLERHEPFTDFEFARTSADGKLRWISTSGEPIFDRHGKFSGYRGVGKDITERKQSEQALRESEARFRLLFEQAPVGMTLRSVDGVRLAANQALCGMIGYTFDELRSGEVKIIHPDFVRQATEQRELMFKGGLDHYQYDTLCLRKDGTSFWVNFWASLIRDAGQRPVMRLAVIQDISARKQAEDEIRTLNAELEKRVAERTGELATANKELEAFAYSVSHDLKAPLRGIDGYSRLLLDNYGDKLDGEGRRFLENVRKGANSMHDLIEDLLAYSRIERGGRAVARLDLRPLVANLVEESLNAADAMHCRVDNSVPDLQVMADREGLIVALRNLLDNALKFGGGASGTRIEIGARSEGASCILWVRDNGPGFDMKYHERIFGMFERLHRGNEFPGTGIGLAIVQKAMARMGGRVWAESEPGKGATFYLEIPA